MNELETQVYRNTDQINEIEKNLYKLGVQVEMMCLKQSELIESIKELTVKLGGIVPPTLSDLLQKEFKSLNVIAKCSFYIVVIGCVILEAKNHILN